MINKLIYLRAYTDWKKNIAGDFNATEIVIYPPNDKILSSDQILNVSSTTCVSNLYCTYSSQYISFVDMLQNRILFSDQILNDLHNRMFLKSLDKRYYCVALIKIVIDLLHGVYYSNRCGCFFAKLFFYFYLCLFIGANPMYWYWITGLESWSPVYWMHILNPRF